MSNQHGLKRVGIVGFSCDSGGIVAGSKLGPKALRNTGVSRLANSLGWDVLDYGDVELATTTPTFSALELSCNRPKEVYAACAGLNHKVKQVIADGRMPLILGGDHSLSIGAVSAVADSYNRIGLLWVDAHPDLNTPKTSPSKNFFGMSVAVLLGLVPGALASLQNKSPAVSFNNLSFIGLRDVDEGERELIHQNCRGSSFSMDDIDEQGIRSVVDQALETVTKDTDGFVLSFDLDACDPNFAPGTGTPKRGGLTYRETHYILERAAASKKMLAAEIVELNPTLDPSGQTTEVAISLVSSILGKTIL